MTAPSRGVVLAIDFGSRTTVGVLTDSAGPRLVGVDGQPWTQSAVYADEGGLVVGTDAVRLARLDPTRFEPSPKRRIDEGEVLLGTEVFTVSRLIDAVVSRVVNETRRQLGGRPVDGLVLTHPAQWANVRQDLLRQIGQKYAARLVLVPEPVAAAMYFAATSDFPLGATLAVYDLGAGTFDAAVVRRGPQGFEVLACDGIDDLGGIDMDQRLFDHVGAKAQAQNPEAWAELVGENGATAESRRRLRALRDDISSAKETLSRRLEIDIPFPNPFTDVHVTRAEYEDLIRADVIRSVDVLAETIKNAGLTPQQLHSIHFVGGASRTPLCGELIAERLGVRPVPIDQPETVVALGGVRAILPAPGQPQAQSGRTGTYAADLDGPTPGAAPFGGPPTGGVPLPHRPPLLPGVTPPSFRTSGPPLRTRPVVGPASGAHPVAAFTPSAGPPTGSHPTTARPGTGSFATPPGGVPPTHPATGSVPAAGRSGGMSTKKIITLTAAAAAVVVAAAAVLVITLGGSDDAATADLPAKDAALLVQKILPKSGVPQGYELFDGQGTTGYKSDPTDIDRSRAGFVCVPQEDSPLPAEAGITAISSMNAVEAGGARTDRPRDQLVMNASYVDPADRDVLVGQIRTKIKDCRDAAPTKSYSDYDYANDPKDISGTDANVGFVLTEPSTDNNGVTVPEIVVVCQIAQVKAVVLRSCAITTKEDTRAGPGGGDSTDGTDRATMAADAELKVLVEKAKSVQSGS